MPSHIYYRVGRYLDALADNKTAVAVDEKYLAETDAPMGVYRLGYYPHNIHFVIASAQMSGDGPTVITAAEKLRGLIPDEVARGIAMVHPVKAAPYFAHAQFSTPETILALPDPGDEIPYVKAMWHYARGVALAAQGKFVEADLEATAIEAIDRSADFALLSQAASPHTILHRAAVLVLPAVRGSRRADIGALGSQLQPPQKNSAPRCNAFSLKRALQVRSSQPLSSELPARIEISQSVGKVAGAMDQAAGERAARARSSGRTLPARQDDSHWRLS